MEEQVFREKKLEVAGIEPRTFAIAKAQLFLVWVDLWVPSTFLQYLAVVQSRSALTGWYVTQKLWANFFNLK